VQLFWVYYIHELGIGVAALLDAAQLPNGKLAGILCTPRPGCGPKYRSAEGELLGEEVRGLLEAALQARPNSLQQLRQRLAAW
jgi:hypothetical protein